MNTVYVEIVAHADEHVVKRMGPLAQSAAEKVDRGANINLNHERFYTRIVAVKDGAP